MKRTPLKRKTPLRAHTPLQARRMPQDESLPQDTWKTSIYTQYYEGKRKKKKVSALKPPRKKKENRKEKKKPKTIGKLKGKLDSVFSQYIRQKYADENGKVLCYTCGKKGHWKTLQNGHFVSRQYLATRWEEDNCKVQCAGCNLFGNGRLLDFEERLKTELGEDRVEEIKRSRHKILKLDRHWYEQKIREYEDILKKL